MIGAQRGVAASFIDVVEESGACAEAALHLCGGSALRGVSGAPLLRACTARLLCPRGYLPAGLIVIIP